MSNLFNMSAYLQDHYADYLSISLGQPPSYLIAIVGEFAGNIVYLHQGKLNRRENIDIVSSNMLSSNWRVESDLNLTGSPLKDDCVVEVIDEFSDKNIQIRNSWLLEEETHTGIKADKARSILHNLIYNNAAYGSVWILCNDCGIGKPLLFEYDASRNYFSRGIITCLGILPVNNINMQSLLKEHLSYVACSLPVESKSENTYRISRHMFLRCSWSTVNSLPLLADLGPSCEVVLIQTFIAKEIGSLTQHLFNQLRILSLIREDIIAFKEAEKHANKEPVYYRGCGIDLEELRESIYEVMTDICDHIEPISDLESDLETVIKRSELRRLCDLTEKLWDIFKRCSSYKHLKYGFNILFQCASRCTIVNTPTNSNHLAYIITEISNKRLAIPSLTGSEPLELLLEIGLEKLYKDYEYIFTESKSCSATDLKPQSIDRIEVDNHIPNLRKSLRFPLSYETMPNKSRKTFLHCKNDNMVSNIDDNGFKNSYFSERETSYYLSRLYQIHVTLEHLLKIHMHLNLKHDVHANVCEQLLRKTVPNATHIDDTLTDKQSIVISTIEVGELLNGKIPDSRRITMKSKNKLKEVQTLFHYNKENIFPPSISEYFVHNEDTLPTESFYYGWLYRKIKTFK